MNEKLWHFYAGFVSGAMFLTIVLGICGRL